MKDFKNRKFFGNKEPQFSKLEELTKVEIISAFNWYNTIMETSDSKKYAIEYLNDPEITKKINNVPDIWWIRSIGWISRLITNGYEVQESLVDSLNESLEKSFSYIDWQDPYKVKVRTPVPNDYLLVSRIEEMIDSWRIGRKDYKFDHQFSMYNYLQTNEYNKTSIEKLKDYLTKAYEEFELLNSGKDAQLNEAYSKYPTSWKRNIQKFYEDLISDINRYLDNNRISRAPRKPRKKKVIPIEKLLSSFSYLKESNEWKLKSINPSNIFTASEVWLFNVKTKSISVLRVKEKEKFTIKGTTIGNYDEDKSLIKGTGRKTKDILGSILQGTKARANKLFSELKGDNKAIGRVNKDTIILKVYT